MSGKTFGGRRVSRQETVEIVEKLAASGLSDICEKFEICGSYRRGLPDSGDIDIVALPKDMKLFLEWFDGLTWTKKIGQIAYYVLIDGVQIDIFIATQRDWGVKIINYTGPFSFNIFLDVICKMYGLRFTRNGVFDSHKNMVSQNLDENEIFNIIKMDFILPADRSSLT